MSFLVVTPAHRCDAQLAIAAARAGETGIVDLGVVDNRRARVAALQSVAKYAGSRRKKWGVRWDLLGDAFDLHFLQELVDGQVPLLILAGLARSPDVESLREVVDATKRVATTVYLEVGSLAEAEVAQSAGFDGVVISGNEAGAGVGDESTFILLQRFHNSLSIPWFVRGGMAPDTAAAVFLAGAAGVVLSEQVWLATESPLGRREQQMWAQLDGSETAVVGDSERKFRVFSRANREILEQFEREVAEGRDWNARLRERMNDDAQRLQKDNFEHGIVIPLSPDIAFAKRLADEHVSVAGILNAFKQRVEENLRHASSARALAPQGPLAQALRTQFPILQGPMTRVSDVAPFCQSVAENGGLPFLALALMRGDEVRTLLTQTSAMLAGKSWGVGILGFVPAELRNEQLAVVRDVRPPFAIVAGGRPSQARQLEEHGIATFLHVPSPGLLQSFIDEGSRKFVFEGRECGGHVGPRSSFILWQSVIDVLTATKSVDPAEFQLIFAGGIHDQLSAALVAALAAPLTARGMKIGVLMGTAYLFTHEAVECGAILPTFQNQAVACSETILLKTGVGHETRCSATPFAAEFSAARLSLIRDGKTPDEVRDELEQLNLGRLRIAAKGRARRAVTNGAKGDLFDTNADEQLQSGMYMIGQIAALRHDAVSMRELHEDVSVNSVARLQKLAKRRLPWQPARNSQARRMRRRAKTRRKTADIAIIGLAGVFPDASDVRTFWENILKSRVAFREVPPERWRAEDYFTPGGVQPDQVYSKWGAFLGEQNFNPMKWLIPPASLGSIDATQLIALDVAWQALVDAGYDRRKFARDRMGVVFASAGSTEMEIQYAFRTSMRHYFAQVKNAHPEAVETIIDTLHESLPSWTEDSFAGFLHNVIPGRITNRLDLGGPNYVVDAACASSLTAIYTAVEHLRSGAADAMLVGAADLTNHPTGFMSFAQTQALSPTGRPRPLDQSADGIALGESVAAVILKRLPDAERAGDRIYAVIKGIGASSDGKARSLTSPDSKGQIVALKRAYDDAQIAPSRVSLIEAHATGTVVGDSAEVNSLNRFFASKNRTSRAAVGSVKSMIGHTKTAAGLVSLIKTAVALDQQILPPTSGVEKPLAVLTADDSPLYVNSESRPWFHQSGEPRRAGINSFGFGGTNFHVVVEEYTGKFQSAFAEDLSPRSAEFISLSRKSRADLQNELERLHAQLGRVSTAGLAQVCYSINLDSERANQTDNACRLSLVVSSFDDLKSKLRTAADLLAQGESSIADANGIYYSEAPAITRDQVCFLYPGQGSQAVNMLRDLVAAHRWAHGFLNSQIKDARSGQTRPLSEFLYPRPAFAAADRTAQQRELNDTRVAQPALGAVEAFATRLLARFGLTPGSVAGHSYGEYVALWSAGCLSFQDLMHLSVRRGEITAQASNDQAGAMAAVAAGGEQVERLLKECHSQATAANWNSPKQTVIAGTAAEVDRALTIFEKASIGARKIPVTAAFHSQAMAPAAVELSRELQAVDFREPGLSVSSNTTSDLYPNSADAIRTLLKRHLVEPVQFERQIRKLHEAGIRLFLEVGPGNVLTKLVRAILPDQSDVAALPIEASGGDAWQQLASTLAQAAVMGLPIKPLAWYESRRLQHVTLEETIDIVVKNTTRKPTDWKLTASRARPASPVPTTTSQTQLASKTRQLEPTPAATSQPTSSTAGSRSIAAVIQRQRQTPSAASPPVESTNHSLTQLSPSVQNPDTNPPMSNTFSNPHEQNAMPQDQATSWMPLVQNTMTQWLELQTAQNRLMERFLEFQERLAFGQLPPVSPVPRSLPAPTPVASRPVVQVPREIVPVAPVAFAPVVVPPEPRQAAAPAIIVPAAPALNNPPRMKATAPVPAAPVAVAVPAAVPAALAKAVSTETVSEVPTTDEFRRDLLLAVSKRTGYPVDVLDENAPLEAGLGIDSIKTVEIFSNLKQYHFYLREVGSDDEDILLMFSQLKTLRAIIDSFDERRKRFVVSPNGDSERIKATSNGHNSNGSNGTSSSPKAVQRYAVTAAEAPAVSSGEKKNS